MKRIILTAVAALCAFNPTQANNDFMMIPIIGSASVRATPYQYILGMTVLQGSGSKCLAIPVPEESVLTITHIGVEVNIDKNIPPYLYINVGRGNGQSGRVESFGGRLNLIGEFGARKRYQGSFPLTILAGHTTTDFTFSASVCALAPDLGDPLTTLVDVVVTGYLTKAPIYDANYIPPPTRSQ